MFFHFAQLLPEVNCCWGGLRKNGNNAHSCSHVFMNEGISLVRIWKTFLCARVVFYGGDRRQDAGLPNMR